MRYYSSQALRIRKIIPTFTSWTVDLYIQTQNIVPFLTSVLFKKCFDFIVKCLY